MPNVETKQHVHALIDRMEPGQVAALVPLLEVMLDPTARRLASVPFDNEEISDEEEAAAAESRLWLETNEPIPNEAVLAEFGLTSEDFERMGRTPLPAVERAKV